MHRDRSVGQLLTRAFGAVVVLIVGAGLAEVSVVLVQQRLVHQLTTHVQPLELANARLRGVLADAQGGLRGYLLTGDSRLLDAYDLARSDYLLAVQEVRELAVGPEAAIVDEQVVRADVWWTLAEEQRRAIPRSTAAIDQVAVGKPLFAAFVTANTDLDLDLAARVARLQRQSSLLLELNLAAVAALTAAAATFVVATAVRTEHRIGRPLGRVVDVLDRLRAGDHHVRADPDVGPVEVRVVAAAVNAGANESDRRRDTDRDAARMWGAVRELGHRIRGHLVIDDAVREGVRGLHETLGADHVLVRMAADQTDVPPLTSLHDEHVGGPLAQLAACDLAWLRSGDVWAAGDPAPAGAGHPPDAERRAWAAVGVGPVLTVAVSSGSDCIGALTLIRDAGPDWTPVEVRLAEVVAADLGNGLHHTRWYERERQLVAQSQELDTAKTDFMSTVSHELRTPLTSIAGYVELMGDAEAGELTRSQRQMLQVIERNTKRLSELIEDMLVLSSIDSAAFRTAKRPVDLIEMVENALAAIGPVAAKASVGLHAEVRGPLELRADPEQLGRVLMSLLSNAVKFTPADGIVTVQSRREDDEVIIVVTDTGMGIPQAEQPALFARFFRASNAIHQAVPGTGLGLAIVRTIVDNHGGRIDLRSTEQVGTTVTVRLPRDS